ncbi:glucose-1-phosphate thymidylyltransferase, partial [Gluconacetobacter sacchari]
MLVGSPAEVAFRMGFIDRDQLRAIASTVPKTELGRVLRDIADGV